MAIKQNNKNSKINWQFTNKEARMKSKKLYPSINANVTIVTIFSFSLGIPSVVFASQCLTQVYVRMLWS